MQEAVPTFIINGRISTSVKKYARNICMATSNGAIERCPSETVYCIDICAVLHQHFNNGEVAISYWPVELDKREYDYEVIFKGVLVNIVSRATT